MADGATCAAHLPMSNYLRNTLDVQNVTMRARIIRSGFRTLDSLAKQLKPKEWVKEVCNAIRRQAGQPATKEVTMELQANLVKLVQWCLYSYMTQKQLLHAQATQDNIDDVSSWLELPPEEVGETTVEKSSEQGFP